MFNTEIPLAQRVTASARCNNKIPTFYPHEVLLCPTMILTIHHFVHLSIQCLLTGLSNGITLYSFPESNQTFIHNVQHTDTLRLTQF